MYETASRYADRPCLWEGLFRVACLVKNDPMAEPVTALILSAARETENGAFPGKFSDQIHTARAVFAVFEYNTDREILKRISGWLRYIEIEFERLSMEDQVLYRPADLMELMVRFYLVSGTRAVLRLCARLRASAFDWTTALHTFQQSIPIIREGADIALNLDVPPRDLDYGEKEKLINHAEAMADGMRFTLYAGMFSGHTQDLSAGKTGWQYLKKHHCAICGGTTASPFLSGRGADRPVGNAALCAWTEAFAAQLILSGTDWAIDELIRIAFNGLDDCLNRDTIPVIQHVNTFGEVTQEDDGQAELYGRMTRAAACMYTHTVTFTQEGVRINYLLPGRIMAMIRKQPVVIQMNGNQAVFRSKKPFEGTADLYLSATASAIPVTTRNGETLRDSGPDTGGWIRANGLWQDGDGFTLEGSGRIHACDTHHQGVCFISRDRLLSLPADGKQFAFTVSEMPAQQKDGKINIRTCTTDRWNIRNGQPADIPVLTDDSEKKTKKTMIPYAQAVGRITMFPRTKNACLK